MLPDNRLFFLVFSAAKKNNYELQFDIQIRKIHKNLQKKKIRKVLQTNKLYIFAFKYINTFKFKI